MRRLEEGRAEISQQVEGILGGPGSWAQLGMPDRPSCPWAAAVGPYARVVLTSVSSSVKVGEDDAGRLVAGVMTELPAGRNGGGGQWKGWGRPEPLSDMDGAGSGGNRLSCPRAGSIWGLLKRRSGGCVL